MVSPAGEWTEEFLILKHVKDPPVLVLHLSVQANTVVYMVTNMSSRKCKLVFTKVSESVVLDNSSFFEWREVGVASGVTSISPLSVCVCVCCF